MRIPIAKDNADAVWATMAAMRKFPMMMLMFDERPINEFAVLRSSGIVTSVYIA